MSQQTNRQPGGAENLNPAVERLLRALYRSVKGAVTVTAGAIVVIIAFPRSWLHVHNAGMSMWEFLGAISWPVFLVVFTAAFLGYSLGLRSPNRIKELYEEGRVSKKELSLNSVAWFGIGVGAVASLVAIFTILG